MDKKNKKLVFLIMVSVLLFSGFFILGCEEEISENEEFATADEKIEGERDYLEEIPDEWKEGQPQGVLVQWEDSVHAEAGVECSDCHGDDPEDISAPSAGDCATCHSQEFEEFSDTTHATALEHAKEHEDKFESQPEGANELACVSCHGIGEEREGQVSEGKTQGDCASCHGSHEFGIEQARQPKSCKECHSGPGNPQYDSYMASEHGVIYETKNDRFDLSGSTEEFWEDYNEEPLPGPTCATCHMEEGKHDIERGMAHDLYGQRVENFEEEFDFMVEEVCMDCHTQEKSEKYLKNADEMAQASNFRIQRANQILQELKEKGLLEHTYDKEQIYNTHILGGQLTGLHARIGEISFAAENARIGAYHMSPVYSSGVGWGTQSREYMKFRSAVQELINQAELERGEEIEIKSMEKPPEYP